MGLGLVDREDDAGGADVVEWKSSDSTLDRRMVARDWIVDLLGRLNDMSQADVTANLLV